MLTSEHSQETLDTDLEPPKNEAGIQDRDDSSGDYHKMLGPRTYFSTCAVGAEHIHCVRKKKWRQKV